MPPLLSFRPLPLEIAGYRAAEGIEMIANALLFTIVILLGYGFWLLDQLKFMARYKAVLFHAYGTTILDPPRRAISQYLWRSARHQPPFLS